MALTLDRVMPVFDHTPDTGKKANFVRGRQYFNFDSLIKKVKY